MQGPSESIDNFYHAIVNLVIKTHLQIKHVYCIHNAVVQYVLPFKNNVSWMCSFPPFAFSKLNAKRLHDWFRFSQLFMCSADEYRILCLLIKPVKWTCTSYLRNVWIIIRWARKPYVCCKILRLKFVNHLNFLGIKSSKCKIRRALLCKRFFWLIAERRRLRDTVCLPTTAFINASVPIFRSSTKPKE